MLDFKVWSIDGIDNVPLVNENVKYPLVPTVSDVPTVPVAKFISVFPSPFSCKSPYDPTEFNIPIELEPPYILIFCDDVPICISP